MPRSPRPSRSTSRASRRASRARAGRSRAPIGLRGRLTPPGGGEISVEGHARVDPLDAELRVRAANVDVAPYRGYVPLAIQLHGLADVDLAVRVPAAGDRQAMTARGHRGAVPTGRPGRSAHAPARRAGRGARHRPGLARARAGPGSPDRTAVGLGRAGRARGDDTRHARAEARGGRQTRPAGGRRTRRLPSPSRSIASRSPAVERGWWTGASRRHSPSTRAI